MLTTVGVRKFGFGALGTAVLVTASLIGTARSGAADPILDSPFGVVDPACSYQCRECTTPGYHDIVVNADPKMNTASSAHLENCNFGSCESHGCGETLAAGELWQAVRNGDGQQIRQLLAANPEQLYYNAGREAVQITCTEGNLIASLPLTERQLAGL